MARNGTLHSWNDDRGFGFITPADGEPDLFVHISAFPRDGVRPVVGERLTYELGRGDHGKLRAINIVRLSVKKRPTPRRTHATPSEPGWLRSMAFVLIAVAGGTYLFREFDQARQRRALADLPAVAAPPMQSGAPPIQSAASQDSNSRCAGRTRCSQMSSCEEATWVINHCPGTQMDGDNDGIPCEDQLCGH